MTEQPSLSLDWSKIPVRSRTGAEIVAACAVCGRLFIRVNPQYRGGCPQCGGSIVMRPETKS